MKYSLIIISLLLGGCGISTEKIEIGQISWDDGQSAEVISGNASGVFLVAGQKCPSGYSVLREYISSINNAVLVMRCK